MTNLFWRWYYLYMTVSECYNRLRGELFASFEGLFLVLSAVMGLSCLLDVLYILFTGNSTPAQLIAQIMFTIVMTLFVAYWLWAFLQKRKKDHNGK